jgi:hypothetical protein
VVIVVALCLVPACDPAVEDEIPFRDEGGGGEELAEADPSPSVLPSPTVPESPSPSPSESLTPTPSPSPTPSRTSEPDEPGDDRPRRRPKPRFAFPRAGSYTYEQQGYEEFCSASCASDPLPRDRSMTISHGHSSRKAIAVVETVTVSSHRTTSTITRYTRDSAFILQVEDTFEFRGSRYPRRYRPGPAIRALQIPLSEGASWSGSWDAATGGNYRIGVQGFDDIQVAGAERRAARVQARFEFRGELDGYLVTTWWVDPRTRVVIASVGSMEVSDGFGRYTTDFDTRLTAGPGYR